MNKEETNEQLPQPLTHIIQHYSSIVKCIYGKNFAANPYQLAIICYFTLFFPRKSKVNWQDFAHPCI